MELKSKLKSNPRLKKLALFLLMPRNQARPRLWVRIFINPFKHHKGKGALIRRRTRMDLMPFNNFFIGDHSTVEDFTTINNGVGDVYIGHRTRIGMGNTLIGPVKIGNDVRFAQNVVLSGLNHEYKDIHIPISEQGVTTMEIVVEDECWLGANVVVVPGVHIGKHSVVAAGSIVTRDVPPFSIAAGNPARLIKQYNPDTHTWEKIKV
jgi:acetyltransferase-like isoleucine patch superfamily enzyme